MNMDSLTKVTDVYVVGERRVGARRLLTRLRASSNSAFAFTRPRYALGRLGWALRLVRRYTWGREWHSASALSRMLMMLGSGTGL